jgi:hypothetical protein
MLNWCPELATACTSSGKVTMKLLPAGGKSCWLRVRILSYLQKLLGPCKMRVNDAVLRRGRLQKMMSPWLKS